VFAPIRGFEHLFACEDVTAPCSPPSPQHSGRARETQATGEPTALE
jgi:hypothetical protein